MRIAGRSVLFCATLISMTAIGFNSVGSKDLVTSAKGGDPVSGRKIYVNTCIRCHGIDGRGTLGMKLVPPPADLTSPTVQDRLGGTLFYRVHEGKPNTAMGAWKNSLSDEEIWDVLAYVRILGSEQREQR